MMYGLDTDESPKQPQRRNSAASSKVSYRSGDVYYKDRDGKLRPGTANSSHAPHPPHFVSDDNFEPSRSMRAKTPFELAVEKNSKTGNVYEHTEEFDLSTLPSNGANGALSY
ncbi:hypothetical protein OS493_029924 [Desmophyllum pertusum]|uniref:Uncharacterized protein n=1 Tax=Desmophyllum pertusum TaxID=174260 RepID=A0A9X0CD86_9CNID|nr:hypothetical protein OS493_029924 [Desmophyllum pertusum]